MWDHITQLWKELSHIMKNWNSFHVKMHYQRLKWVSLTVVYKICGQPNSLIYSWPVVTNPTAIIRSLYICILIWWQHLERFLYISTVHQINIWPKMTELIHGKLLEQSFNNLLLYMPNYREKNHFVCSAVRSIYLSVFFRRYYTNVKTLYIVFLSIYLQS